MEESSETALTPKIYMVDTNVFRYQAYKIGDTSIDGEARKKKHQDDAKEFFEKTLEHANNRKALIMVSDETKQELIVQAYTLKAESKTYKKLLKKFSVEDTDIPKSLEFMIRDFSNYIRGKYTGTLVPIGKQTNYLQASDARILIHAYLNDAIIVTANIKDFFFYPLFFKPTEDDVLYDISSKQFQKLLPAARIQLLRDEKFIDLLNEMQKLKD